MFNFHTGDAAVLQNAPIWYFRYPISPYTCYTMIANLTDDNVSKKKNIFWKNHHHKMMDCLNFFLKAWHRGDHRHCPQLPNRWRSLWSRLFSREDLRSWRCWGWWRRCWPSEKTHSCWSVAARNFRHKCGNGGNGSSLVFVDFWLSRQWNLDFLHVPEVASCLALGARRKFLPQELQWCCL